MDAVWINFLYNPLLPLGAVLSLIAAFAFLEFLRGFLSSVIYLFTLNGNDEFLKAARVRVMWSFLLLIALYCTWQFLQWIGALLTGGPSPKGLVMAIILLNLLILGNWGAGYLKRNAP